VGLIEPRDAVVPEPLTPTRLPVSFDDLYASEYGAVVRVAFALTGRLGVAEELTQEAFLAAYRRWDRVGLYDDPAAWVRRVVTHRCVSFWRRGLTELRMMTRLGRERSTTVVIPEGDERVLAAVRRLPPRQREVIALVLLEDRAVNEVADILGCATETVRTHLRRGRLALAESLQQTEDL
jgi:RNA polymerase sigma-70 factor (ECF subfamily)